MGIQINGQTDTVTATDGSINVGGNLNVPGVLTYDDVTSIDSVGVVTARSGVNITGGDLTLPDAIIHAGDTNTRIRFPASDTFTVETAGNERLRITSAGNIGIGENTPGTILHIKKNDATGPTITLENGSNETYINNWGSSGPSGRTNRFEINAVLASSLALAGQSISLQTGAAGDSNERLRIDSVGNVTLGFAGNSLHFQNGFNNSTARIQNGGGSNNSELKFLVRNAGTESEKMRLTSTAGLAVVTAGSMSANAGNETLYIQGEGHSGHGTSNTRSVVSIIGALTSNNSAAGLWVGARTNENTAVIGTRTANGNLAVETYSGGVWGERFHIRSSGGHTIKCNESWHAANLSECNTDRLALNINQTRQGQTKGIAIGCVGGGSGSTGIQAYDTSDNSANNLELNPFGGKLLYGDTQSDLIGDHKTMFIGSKHAFQYDGNAGTYLSVILGSANGTVDLEADARSGSYPAMRFITTNYERLRITNDGTLHHPTGGNVWHGASALDDFSNAGITNYNRIGIRAGSPDAGTTPVPNSTAIKIYPVGSRSTTTGNLTGGIAWQHLDPSNGTWDTNYGAGAQIWMGASLHDTPGQERDRFNLWMNSQTANNSQPNQLAIEAYPNGMVRHPKVPAFMVRSSNNSGAFSGGAIATWNVTILNNGSGFANGKFTAPINGIYYFSCMMLSQAGLRLFHEFRVNGTRVDGTRSEGHAVSNSYQTNTITMTYSLSASDYVEVYVGPNAGYGGTYTNFNGFLVG